MDVAGYSVEALDGGIGKVDEATYDVGSSYIVVDTGPWILGKKASSFRWCRRSDRHGGRDNPRQAYEADQIKDAPEMSESTYPWTRPTDRKWRATTAPRVAGSTNRARSCRLR